ncbi:MAG: GNAT family N-acetyltransferase [Planctomycetota bacterium]|jgi:GNAT superfamily N-acetyltransferase
MDFAIRPVEGGDRPWIDDLVKERWSGEIVVTRGTIHRPAALPGFVAVAGEDRVGLLTYRIAGPAAELVTLDSLHPGKGIGTALLDALLDAVAEESLDRVWLVTTNDNAPALRFYRKRGFAVVAAHRDAIKASRKRKPEIPRTGIGGIPIRDEIELEMKF